MKWILDCDPGHDDMVMLLVALKRVEVLGVTTVAGNQTIEKVTRNALKVLELAGARDVPVAQGAARSLLGTTCVAPEWHGESGLDGYDVPEPTTRPAAEHAVEFIHRVATAHDDVGVIATGPLTNLALALAQYPELASRIGAISLMGGSTSFGNMSPVAEFNIYVDPEAADAAFASGIPITMYGLNVTCQVPLDAVLVGKIRGLGNRIAEPVAGWLDFYLDRSEELLGRRVGFVHDLCALAGVVQPGLFEYTPAYVRVELTGRRTRGMTVCDQRFALVGEAQAERLGDLYADFDKARPNTQVGVRADADRVNEFMLAALAEY